MVLGCRLQHPLIQVVVSHALLRRVSKHLHFEHLLRVPQFRRVTVSFGLLPNCLRRLRQEGFVLAILRVHLTVHNGGHAAVVVASMQPFLCVGGGLRLHRLQSLRKLIKLDVLKRSVH